MALKLLGKKSSKAKEEEGDNSIDTTESTQSKSPSKHHRRSFNIFQHQNHRNSHGSSDNSFEFRGMVNALNRSHSTSKKTRPLSPSPQKSNSLIVSSSNSSKVKKPKLSTADTSYEDRRYNLPENQETQTNIDQLSHDKMNSMEDRIALRQDQNDPAISFDVKLASAQGSELLLNPHQRHH